MENKNEATGAEFLQSFCGTTGYGPEGWLCAGYPMESVVREEEAGEEEKMPKKRGRKKLRPNNPTKTEVMDKFWLRGFREFMKTHYGDVRPMLDGQKFWDRFLGRHGVPGKKGEFLSYSKAYKETLFGNKGFAKVFAAWGWVFGLAKVPRRNFKGSWQAYYEYLVAELLEDCRKQLGEEDFREGLAVMSCCVHSHWMKTGGIMLE
jgi:hypothetical protein